MMHEGNLQFHPCSTPDNNSSVDLRYVARRVQSISNATSASLAERELRFLRTLDVSDCGV